MYFAVEGERRDSERERNTTKREKKHPSRERRRRTPRSPPGLCTWCALGTKEPKSAFSEPRTGGVGHTLSSSRRDMGPGKLVNPPLQVMSCNRQDWTEETPLG